jgi:hypothetical protein
MEKKRFQWEPQPFFSRFSRSQALGGCLLARARRVCAKPSPAGERGPLLSLARSLARKCRQRGSVVVAIVCGERKRGGKLGSRLKSGVCRQPARKTKKSQKKNEGRTTNKTQQ